MKKVILFAVALLTVVSCGGQKAKKSTVSEAGAAIETAAVVETAGGGRRVAEYPIPEIPSMMTEPAERARWAAEHYWDNFDFTDTLGIENWSAYVDQAFVNFNYHLLDQVPYDIGDEAVGVLFRKAAADKDIFLRFAEVAEKNLFDANSPWRDEESYISVLRAVLASTVLDEWERIRPGEQLRLALKNRVGDRAADFRYTLASGATGTLHTLDADFTLLFFNNPGCPTCRDFMAEIMSSPYLVSLIDKESLRVLAVYPDEDLTAWREYLPSMPTEWIVSYDATRKIENDELYDLKAIPTLYLLDRTKTVMLKDVMSVPLIEQTLNNSIKR